MKRQIRKILLTTALVCGIATAGAAPRATSVRSVDTDFNTDSQIIPPASFETDVHKMMENWYLRNYARLDKDADSRSSVEATDEEYIDRLQKMNTVIEMPYNQKVRAFINMYVNRKKGLVESMLGMSLYYMPIFEQVLDRYGLPMELKYLPVIESALNPNAVSPVGATGLWQFMLGTATGQGLEVNSVVDERRDPIRSSDAAARYLKTLYNTYKDWSLAIAAYNCGPGNVNKALRRAGGGKLDFWEIYRFLPSETRDYVPAFIAANYAMNYYDKHNISPALAAKPILTDTVHVARRVHFEQISEVMDIPVDELRALNPQYRQDIIPGDVKPYPLVLPNLQVYCYIANEDSIVNHNAEKYARREVVEPATGVKSADGKGDYVDELVVKYHKVRRGETLASIARKYGVTASSIRKTNGIGRKVRRGKTLRINTYVRKYIERAPEVTDSLTVTQTAPADSIQAPAATPLSPDSVASANAGEAARVSQAIAKSQEAKVEEEKPVQQPKPKPQPKPRNIKHKISSGENLTKIAKKYGVTVDDIKKANNMTGDNIQMGKTLVIPAKESKSGRSKYKSRRRRR